MRRMKRRQGRTTGERRKEAKLIDDLLFSRAGMDLVLVITNSIYIHIGGISIAIPPEICLELCESQVRYLCSPEWKVETVVYKRVL